MWRNIVFVLFYLIVADCYGNYDLQLRVKVDGKEKIPSEANQTHSVATYSFFDGEYLSYSCHRNQGYSSLLQISSNVHGNIEITRKRTNNTFLNLKLTKENDGNFINCYRYSHSNEFLFVSQLNFKRTDRKPDQQKEPVEAPPKCEKNQQPFDQNGDIKCVSGTAIKGLRKENILGMFYRNTDIFTILYDYGDEETMELKCDALDPQWSYNGAPVDKPNSTFYYIADAFNKTKQLKSKETKINITCTDGKETDRFRSKSIEVIFMRRDYPTNTNLLKEPDNVPSGKETPVPGERDVDNADVTQEPDSWGMPFIATVTGLAVVFIALLFFITLQLFKRKSVVPPNTDSNINYENLPEHNAGSMPVPRQWQEAQYSAPADRIANNDYAVPFRPNLDEMYATPIPKNQRLEDDPQYASIEKSNPTYAQAVPKYKRTGVAVLPTGIDSTYAELSLKPGIAKKPKVTPIESPYAEVSSKKNSEHSYADPSNLQSKGYVNVFDNPRYVNADSKDDYAEPAYCEISNHQK